MKKECVNSKCEAKGTCSLYRKPENKYEERSSIARSSCRDYDKKKEEQK